MELASERQAISTDSAPAAIGPYSQAITHGELLFCSGQIPLDPASGELVGQTVAQQTERCLNNLAAVCREAGTTIGNAVRCTIYTTHLDQFAELNAVYERFFDDPAPARVTVGVSALPKGALVEIEATVALRR